MRTQAELEVALVVGGHVHRHLDDLAGAVGPHDDALAVGAAPLTRTGLGEVPGVSTLTTPSPVLAPLPPEPPAVGLVVVVVRRSTEPKPPGRGASWGLYQPAVGQDKVHGGEEEQVEQRHDVSLGLPSPSAWQPLSVEWDIVTWESGFIYCGTVLGILDV